MAMSTVLARAARGSRVLTRASSSAAAAAVSTGSNPALSFPCVDQHQSRVERIKRIRPAPVNDDATAASDGPEPVYGNVSGYQTFHHPEPVRLDYGGVLRQFDIAYETWGKLNADRSNAILIHTGLSASSHARSSPSNPVPGWWERFIGPGKAIDTDQFFVICTNVLGGCYGSTGPSSRDPSDGKHYATRFPILSIFDMVRAQFKLLDHLGIKRLYASVGSSMGGMQSLAAAHLEPERVGKVVSISGTARTSPASIALRYAQRSGMYF
jgi:homoserine acetyltransferase